MNALDKLIALPIEDKTARGLLHTPREIRQQPETWQRNYELFKEQSRNTQDFLDRAGINRQDDSMTSIYLVGAGTSDYIGRALSSLLRRQWHSDVQAVPSTDLLTNMDDYILAKRRTLWISFSRSGDSSEGVAAIESALERFPAVHHLIVTCNGEGRMARDFINKSNVFCITLDDVVNDRGLAMTSSFTNMVIVGQCLAHLWELSVYEPVLENLIASAQQSMGLAADQAARLANENFEKVFLLGTGSLKAVAVESALKLSELTAGRILTFAESYLGIRHGPLSIVDAQTLIIGFLSGDARRRLYELDLLREIQTKQLAGKIITVGPIESTPQDLIVEHIPLAFSREVKDDYRPPVDVIFGQLLGLFSSLQRNLKPDTPSPQGAISRVVTQVNLY